MNQQPEPHDYVHGYGSAEQQRLQDQATTLEALLHADTHYGYGERVLEAGCGTGAQTLALARNSPGVKLTSIDINPASLAMAEMRLTGAGLGQVTFRQADILALPFPEGSFDHVFACFVLEHLSAPDAALAALRYVLRPGGSLTVIEGDHGSVLFHPENAAARHAIACQVELQRRAGGDAMIGRRLSALLRDAGFEAVRISPRLIYADAGRPALVEGFIRRTFTAMVAGVREPAIAAGLTNAAAFDAGIAALERSAAPDGSFSYQFFKGIGRKP